jgi:hypothetical protein
MQKSCFSYYIVVSVHAQELTIINGKPTAPGCG